MNGLLLVDKPAGPTSHDIVAQLRKQLGEKKSGHAGTLDPQATGLLVLAFGEATKWLPYLPSDKRYRATARFGLATDSEDIWGTETAKADASQLSAAQLQGAVEALRHETSQVPPMLSALKRDGTPLYELQRQGIVIEREARPLEVFEIKVLEVRPGEQAEVDFEVHCGSGTYVRTLCSVAGAKLAMPACMSALKRLSVGPFELDAAVAPEGAVAGRLLGAGRALAHLKELKVGPELEAALSHGNDIGLAGDDWVAGEDWRLSDSEGRLLALAVPQKVGAEWRMKPGRVFNKL